MEEFAFGQRADRRVFNLAYKFVCAKFGNVNLRKAEIDFTRPISEDELLQCILIPSIDAKINL